MNHRGGNAGQRPQFDLSEDERARIKDRAAFPLGTSHLLDALWHDVSTAVLNFIPRWCPWAVCGLDEEVGTVRVHFLDPVAPDIVEAVQRRVSRHLPMTMRLVISQRDPLCTIHDDCLQSPALAHACYAPIHASHGEQ